MDNETKLSSQQINSIINEAKNADIKNKEDADAFIKKHLDQGQAEKVKSVLGDPEKMKKLMESPFAKKLMESFLKKQNSEQNDGLE